MELIELVDRLDNEINGKKGLFSKVDVGYCGELVGELKSQVLGLKKLIQTHDAVIQNADTVAQNVIAEAKQRADFIAGEDEIVRLAEIKGRKIIDETYRECEDLIKKTKDYLEDMLCRTEDCISNFLLSIRSKRNELRNTIFNAENN